VDRRGKKQAFERTFLKVHSVQIGVRRSDWNMAAYCERKMPVIAKFIMEYHLGISDRASS